MSTIQAEPVPDASEPLDLHESPETDQEVGFLGARLSLENVTLEAGHRTLLENVTLDLPAGGIVLIVGVSGSGKSLLMRALAGLPNPDPDNVRLSGSPTSQLSYR